MNRTTKLTSTSFNNIATSKPNRRTKLLVCLLVTAMIVLGAIVLGILYFTSVIKFEKQTQDSSRSSTSSAPFYYKTTCVAPSSTIVSSQAYPTLTSNLDDSDDSEVGFIFWHSRPVSSNETVVVTGSGWNQWDDLIVQMVSLPNVCPDFPGKKFRNSDLSRFGLTVRNTTVYLKSNYSLHFIIPGDLPNGVYAFRVIETVKNQLVSSWKILNNADGWFAQGDTVRNATVGGYIGVYGLSMSVSNCATCLSPLLALVSNETVVYCQSSVPKALQNNRWAQYFDIPNNIIPGKYDIYVHNGAGGDFGWSKVSFYDDDVNDVISYIYVEPMSIYDTFNLTVYLKDYFNVSTDDNKRFEAAFNLILKRGGGTIYVPEGTFYFNYCMYIPLKCRIIGAGIDKTKFIWNSQTRWQGSLMLGDSFWFEGFTMQYFPNDPTKCNQAAISREYFMDGGPDVRVFSVVRKVKIINADPSYNSSCKSPNLGISGGIIVWAAKSTLIEDVSIFDVGTGVGFLGGTTPGPTYSRITRLNVTMRQTPVEVNFGNNHVIEDSVRTMIGNATENNWGPGGQPGLMIGPYGRAPTRNVYYGNNTSLSTAHVWNDDTVTDGGGALYFGNILSISGTNITLGDRLRWLHQNYVDYKCTPDAYPNGTNLTDKIWGSSLFVTSGKGMGQSRYVRFVGPYNDVNPWIVIDKPFDIEPDLETLITINPAKGKLLLVNNRFDAEGIHMVGYISPNEVVYADNMIAGKDITTFAQVFDLNANKKVETLLWYLNGPWCGNGSYPGAPVGGWYHQVINNTINANSTGLVLKLNYFGNFQGNFTWYTSLGKLLKVSTMGYGNIVRNIFNPFGYSFSVYLDQYFGASLIENLTNVTNVFFSTTQNYLMIRNVIPQFPKNFTFGCNSKYCNGSLPSDSKYSCYFLCDGNSTLKILK